MLPTFINMVVDKFLKDPSVIFIGCFTLGDCWIGWDSVVCAYFYMFKNLGRCDTKLRLLVDIVVCLYFDSHGEDSGEECHGG